MQTLPEESRSVTIGGVGVPDLICLAAARFLRSVAPEIS